MEKAKIYHIEDDAFFSNVIRMSLDIGGNGHTLIGNAGTIDEALSALEDRSKNLLDFDLLLLDGNLSRESRSGADAKKIIQYIKELNLNLIIIGCSGDNLKDNFVEVDYELNKTDFTVDKLVKLIDEI